MQSLLVETLFEIVLVAIGITYVISGSKIGHPLRFIWCWVLDKIHLSYFWSIVICPPCNAWWVGLATGWFYGNSIVDSLACAFATCGVVAAIQAVGLSIGMQAEEDYNKLIPRRGK
jgi:hypothetical protein